VQLFVVTCGVFVPRIIYHPVFNHLFSRIAFEQL